MTFNYILENYLDSNEVSDLASDCVDYAQNVESNS